MRLEYNDDIIKKYNKKMKKDDIKNFYMETPKMRKKPWITLGAKIHYNERL